MLETPISPDPTTPGQPKAPPRGLPKKIKLAAAPQGGGGGGYDLSGLPTGGGGGADIPPDAFKKKRGNAPAILIGLILVALAAVVMIFAFKEDAKKMSVEERVDEQNRIFVLPEKDQRPQWRKWAQDKTADESLRSEALNQLGLLDDEQTVAIANQMLQEPSHALRGTAAQVLAHVGSPGADQTKPNLVAALKEAEESDERQIVWALVKLGEQSVFDKAMDLYAAGKLAQVQRLEGGGAFSPLRLAKLVSLDQLAGRAKDPSPAIRQLVATVLSENAEPKFTDALISLVQDSEVVVARQAASGLGRIGDAKARGPLLEALRNADKDSRQKFLEALRDGIGGEGLVLALDTVTTKTETAEWFQTKQLFDMLHLLADPRSADSLVKWLDEKKRFQHWETEAGIVLAEIGDVRGVKYIGRRMGIDNADIYEKNKFWQADKGGHMTRNDIPRTAGARMMADLAILHPDKHAEMLEWAEDSTIKWLTDKPQPHANGLRFLANVNSPKIRKQMRDWAFPTEELPAEGAQPPFPAPFVVAQSGLRYIGKMQDKQSLPKLLKQFGRKDDAKMDITQEGLMGAGLSVLGMCLRAVAYGAAEGLNEWEIQGDKKVETTLIEFIEDKLWHHQAREAACAALPYVASAETMTEVVEKVGKYAASDDPRDQLIGACYTISLRRRPLPEAVDMMVDLLRPELELNVRRAIGHAIGVTGVPANSEAEKKLIALLENDEMRTAAAVALTMGGTEDAASRAVAAYGTKDRELSLTTLKDDYFRAFGYWSSGDVDNGNLFRWVRNAQAISRVRIKESPQEWAKQRLTAQFDNLMFDNGPHSETRVVLRNRLYKLARGSDAEKREGAINTLLFMGEQGVLMALREEKGEAGTLANEAFHRLMNPSLAVREDLSTLQKAQSDSKK